MSKPLCDIQGINKSFSGVQVLFDVSMQIHKGDVVGLAGENGAGKSTLMKTIAGTHIPEKGEIWIEDKKIPFGHPLAIQKMGISVIYQEFSLIPQLSVAENLFMRHSAEKRRLSTVKWKEMYRDSEQYLEKVGAISVDPRALVQDLSVANKQLVEIAKALTIHPKLLLMDEPSATLNGKETEHLFDIVHDLKKEGVGIIYITHRLEEFFETCNRLIVLKDGVVTDDCGMDGLTKDDIINKMVGRDVKSFFVHHDKQLDKSNPMLSVQNLRSEAGTHDVSFDLYKGEILGVAGLNGAGRSEMIRAICGLDGGHADRIEIDGKKVNIKGIRSAIDQGIAYLPEERKTQGLVLTMSVKENMSYAAMKKFCKNKVIHRKLESSKCGEMIGSLRVKCSGPNQIISNLSGGNQQKVIVGKWMLNEPKIYLMDEPTRGIDVGAKHDIYELMKRLTDEGASVIFVSSELPELLGVSDRILVMANGTITGEVERAEATEEKVMSYAFAAKEEKGA